jgi:imidazolonepropionase-like amidohydrolase
VLACGRFLSSKGRYFPDLHTPVPPEELVHAVHEEIAAGAAWVKLVADFPALDNQGQVVGPIDRVYDRDTVRAVVQVAHQRGARVAAHTNSAVVADLVADGVDSVEHGESLQAADLEQLAQRGGAWTPTLCAGAGPRPSESAESRRRREARDVHVSEMLRYAESLGVTILAGSDVVGTVAGEVAMLVQHGLTVDAALAAASTAAHSYLQLATTADLVTYETDPREDLGALRSPAAVVIGGLRVR